MVHAHHIYTPINAGAEDAVMFSLQDQHNESSFFAVILWPIWRVDRDGPTGTRWSGQLFQITYQQVSLLSLSNDRSHRKPFYEYMQPTSDDSRHSLWAIGIYLR